MENQPTAPKPPKLLDQVNDAIKTMIYTHVLSRGGLAVRSPLD